MPLANRYLTAADLAAGRDQAYPLHTRVCSACLLVQADAPVSPEAIFSDYAYFSSYSDSWVEHARHFAQQMISRLALDSVSQVVEVGSNDGYLLRHFVAAGIPALGIDPAANIAKVARAGHIQTEIAFFGSKTARQLAAKGIAADLIAANNVLAHVPDIADFVRGFSILLKPDGLVTCEFPHILNLIHGRQFDTIYHEHFSYLSLFAVERILAIAGLRVFDVEELSTHGGSLRVYACHAAARHAQTERLGALRAKEQTARLNELAGYLDFAHHVADIKRSFLNFLQCARAEGKRIAAYGAAAKGATFLNVCGVDTEDIICVFDRSPAKQGKFLPGSHLPILPPEDIQGIKPDYLLILPWNISGEIRQKMAFIGDWGGKFVTTLPTTQSFPA